MITSGLGPYDYLRMLKYIKKLEQDFPFISAKSIGKSVMGKDITALSIGSAEEYVLFVGGIHGSEHYSCGFLLNFFHDLCRAIADNKSIEGLNARRALKGRALMVIPSINPDGCEIASKGKVACGNREQSISQLAQGRYKTYDFNARGVDIDQDFTAPTPSEPETSAAISYFKNIPIRHLLLLGIGDGRLASAKNEKLPARADRMLEIMTASSKLEPTEREDELCGGFVEWFCDSRLNPSFRVLPEIKDFSPEGTIRAYKEIRELLMLTSIM